MLKEVLISYIGEDKESVLNLSQKLSEKGITSKIVISNPFAEGSNVPAIVLILSKDYLTTSWFNLISENQVNDFSSKTKLVILATDKTEIPKIFLKAFVTLIADPNNCDAELSRACLYLQGYTKNFTNAPMSKLVNMM